MADALRPGQRDVGEQRVAPAASRSRYTTPSWRPTRRLSRWATSWVSTTRLPRPSRLSAVSSTDALEVLGLVDHDEAVGEAAAPDVGEREHLEQPAVDDLVDHLAARPSTRARR